MAVEVLLKVEQDGAFANPALSSAFKNQALTERDRAFVTYIVQGTLRHQMELDEEIGKLSKKPLARLTPALRAVLRSAIFQLIHLDDMPASAVINTAVEIARKTGHEGSAKFVNGVLRAFERSRQKASNREELTPALPENTGFNGQADSIPDEAGNDSREASDEAGAPSGNKTSTQSSAAGRLNDKTRQELSFNANDPAAIEKLAKRYSLPSWILKRWMQRFGEEECLCLLAYSQKIPVLTLRTCEMSISAEGLLDILQGKGMTVERSVLMPACINVMDRGNTGGPVSKLPGYKEGLFAVQDDASAFVSIVLAPKPGQTIIDLCAAPGGKSVHLGELMQNKGRVIAVDSNEKRLSLLGSERRRLGLANIETVVKDGRTFQPDAPCDAVLVDSPCSGTGVMNRRSDLRQHREESHISSLVETQRALLENAAKMLKPGGVLVYSTCSIEAEENEENLVWFLEKHPEYKPENLEPFFNQEILRLWQAEKHWTETWKQIKQGYIQLLPSRHGSSGFFICRLKREG